MHLPLRVPRRAVPLLLAAAALGLLLVTQASAAPPPHANANAHANAPEQRNFRAPLSAGEEVADPPVVSNARGNAIFQLSKDGTELRYRLIVANIENVTMAHIHCGAAGVNGPVVAWLYPADGPPAALIEGRSSGILDEGVITNSAVVAQPDSAACPGGVANFTELLSKIRSGEAYVNVHTEQFEAGEVRGQIR